MHDSAYDERYVLAIYLSDLSGGDEPIQRTGFKLGNDFLFPFL
jgi:hypothetical protein